MKVFDVSSKDELAKLLLVHPDELELVNFSRGKLYRSSRIRKADGSVRILHVPQGPLKLLQHKVQVHILNAVRPLDCVHGGVKGRSVVTNALRHVGKAIVFTIDVRDFFPSVSSETVFSVFQALGFKGEAASLLVKTTTWDGRLPQGAPTSPAIANLSMTRVDVRLQGLAERHSLAYTRYVDDLTFSGPTVLKKLRGLIQRIVEEEGFHLNPQKTATMHSGMRQVVTTLVVNSKLNLAREYRQSVRRNAIQLALMPKALRGRDGSFRGRLSWVGSINPDLAAKLGHLAKIA